MVDGGTLTPKDFMASTTGLDDLTSAFRHATRELPRIAAALVRMSPPPAKVAPPAPLSVSHYPDEPSINAMGF